MRPYFRNVGFICTGLFSAAGLASTLAAYFNIDGSFERPKLSALIFGLFWSAFTLLGIWLLLLYYKYRLFLDNSSLRQIGVLRDNQIDLNLVDELKWRWHPKGGSVRISSILGVLKIDLGNFQPADRDQLIDFLRQTVAESKQLSWQEFTERFGDSPEKRQRSRRARMLLVFVFGAHAIAFGIIWAVGGDLFYLAMSAVNALMAAYLLRSYLRDRIELVPLASERAIGPDPD